MAGGTPRPGHPAPRRRHFRLDLDELRAAVTDRTRLLLLNTPHNPTGTVLTRDELAADRRDSPSSTTCWSSPTRSTSTSSSTAPSTSRSPPSPACASARSPSRSAGKTFSFTGWKVGWVTATAELVAAVRTAKQFLTYVSRRPLPVRRRRGARACPTRTSTDFRADLRAKRDLLGDGPHATAGFEVYRPAGTYFITTDIRPLGENDGFAFCRALPERCGVVAIPNAVFYDHPDAGRTLVRFAFCKKDDVLQEARTAYAAWRRELTTSSSRSRTKQDR